MEYRRLGRSGLQISTLSFGSWVTFGSQVDSDIAEACMAAAYDAGINFFDNAESYASGRSELLMGKLFKKFGWDRDSYIVSSKVYWGSKNKPLPTQRGLSAKHVAEACHQALRRLQVDYLDLYFCHRPDKETPVEETVRAMHNLIVQGKVLYWGTSQWSALQIMEAYSAARQYNLTPPTMEQPQYHMFHRDRVEVEYARLYDEIGLGTTTWSPLASGLLTGKYNDGIPSDSRANLEGYEWLKRRFTSDTAKKQIETIRKLGAIAGELGTNMPRLAIAWCLKNPNVSTVITGASRVDQLMDNLGALELVKKLDDEIMLEIERILDNKPVQPEF
ncbi:MAG: potassium channel beta subunit family protein [Candidatus Promineifilaceae bacterium]